MAMACSGLDQRPKARDDPGNRYSLEFEGENADRNGSQLMAYLVSEFPFNTRIGKATNGGSSRQIRDHITSPIAEIESGPLHEITPRPTFQ